MWYICTVEYYSTIRQSEIMPFAARWMNLEIILIGVSQTEKRNIVQLPLYVESRKK